AGAPEFEETRRNEAHMAVEECMIAANRCAADFLISRRIPALHRIHKKPEAASVQNLRKILKPLGTDLPRNPVAADFAAAWGAIAEKDAALAECFLPVVLGVMARAAYAPDEKTGHFGLACPHYLHFTSPIRRYPDLLTHRAVIAGLSGEKIAGGGLEETGAHCSQSEIIADKMGWECRQRLLCALAADKVGSEYEVMVSGVTHFGVFVTAGELGLDGVMRFSSMPGYWRYDAGLRRAVNRASGDILELGGRLRAKLSAVAPEKGRADFVSA
ncbi:MAG: RNB domain-containing ribonuclease, partial [Betaproteobacteria bacterium]|nr:RNB domain-containing ribonuclease [Betaproteobacteria bacterium]